MRHRTFRGKLSYRHDTKGETGREWFTVTVQPDGTRTHDADLHPTLHSDQRT